MELHSCASLQQTTVAWSLHSPDINSPDDFCVCRRPLAEVDLLEALLPRVPIQLFGQKDSRGHVCFDYARRTHWAAWVDFLKEHRDFLLIQAAKLKKEDDTGSAEKGTTYKIVG